MHILTYDITNQVYINNLKRIKLKTKRKKIFFIVFYINIQHTLTNMCEFRSFYFSYCFTIIHGLKTKKGEHEEKRICILTFVFYWKTWTDENCACLLVIQISVLPCYFLLLLIFHYLIRGNLPWRDHEYILNSKNPTNILICFLFISIRNRITIKRYLSLSNQNNSFFTKSLISNFTKQKLHWYLLWKLTRIVICYIK
jgi:hypothetical protein